VGVVSSEEKGELVMRLGARGYLNRKEFPKLSYSPPETPEREKERLAETRRLGQAIRKISGGKDVDVVFEHVGQETFPASVLLAKRFGKIVICGATSGYKLDFDVRYLWMRQKQILGSHFCNAFQAERANQLVLDGAIRPVVDQVFDLRDTAKAHALMASNGHAGKMVINVQASAAAEKGPDRDARLGELDPGHAAVM
jgi:crotonyl-CoA carboxylase/reductase